MNYHLFEKVNKYYNEASYKFILVRKVKFGFNNSGILTESSDNEQRQRSIGKNGFKLTLLGNSHSFHHSKEQELNSWTEDFKIILITSKFEIYH